MYKGQDELFAGYPWYSDVVKEWGYLRLHEQLWEDLSYLYDDTDSYGDHQYHQSKIAFDTDFDLPWTLGRLGNLRYGPGVFAQVKYRFDRSLSDRRRGVEPGRSGAGLGQGAGYDGPGGGSSGPGAPRGAAAPGKDDLGPCLGGQPRGGGAVSAGERRAAALASGGPAGDRNRDLSAGARPAVAGSVSQSVHGGHFEIPVYFHYVDCGR